MVNNITYLKNSYHTGKLSHAYILSGNSEDAKMQAVQEFLAIFKASASKDSVHPDITVLEPEKSEITIAQIRKLKEIMAKTPWQLPLKIAILKKAENMNQEAQSAFLKLLEEPRGSAVFFLLTTHALLLLDTIRSRGQELRFFAPEKKEDKKETLWNQLSKLSLAQRFAKAKEWGEDGEKVYMVLTVLLREGRMYLLKALNLRSDNLKNMRAKIALLLYVRQLLKETQINKRLALEQVFLEL